MTKNETHTTYNPYRGKTDMHFCKIVSIKLLYII